MLKGYNFADFIVQFRNSIQVLKDTLPFIKKHQLWKGFFQYKWVLVFTIIISTIFTYLLFYDILNWFSPEILPDISPESIEAGLGIDADEVKDAIKGESRKAIFSGGSKYMLLILLEVVTFHFSVKTLSLLTHSDKSPKFVDFVNAEKRMVIVMVRNFVKGIIAQAIIILVLSILGFKNLSGFFMFFIYSYFLGYAFLDNYNEQYAKTIKNSDLIVRKHVGAATTIGLLTNLLLFVPLLGGIFAPIYGSIAASIYGEKYQIEGEDSLWMFDKQTST